MASFVQSERVNPTENYTGRSRGVDRAQPNNAFGTLFEGIGNVVESVTKAVDDRNQRVIDDELRTGIDAIRGAQGVDAVVNNPEVMLTNSQPGVGGTGGNGVNGGSATPPPTVDNATNEIARFTQAYKDGRISDTMYYAKVESLARQVRAKYPGYREIIDQKVSSIIGTNPANALRSSILQQLGAAQSEAKSKANSQESWVNQNLEYIPPNLRQQWDAGNRSPELYAQMRDIANKRQIKKADVSDAKSEYELARLAGNATEEQVLTIATKEANTIVNNIINNGLSVGGSGAQLYNSILEMVKTGKRPSPEDVQKFMQQYGALELQTDAALNKAFSDPFNDNGDSIASSLKGDTTKLKNIKEQAMAPLKAMREALVNGDTGLFSLQATYAKAAQSKALSDLLEKSQAARTLGAARQIMGDNLGQLLLRPGILGTVTNDFAAALRQLSVTELVSGQGPTANQQIKRAMAEAGGDTNKARVAIVAQLNASYGLIKSKELPTEALANTVTRLFDPGDNFLNSLSGNSREKMFLQFTSPEAVQNIARLKNENPTAWANYISWVDSSIQSSNVTNLGTIKQWTTDAVEANRRWRFGVVADENGRLVVQNANPAVANDAAMRGAESSGLTRAVQGINSSLDSLRRVAEANGSDPNQAVKDWLEIRGIIVPEGETAKRPLADKQGSNNTQDAGARVQLASDEMIDISDDGDTIDLDAQETRRGRTRPSGPVDMSSVVPPTADLRSAITIAATELGISPVDLATVISYETGGKFDPSIRGGAGNRHIGLIQFGTEEQRVYGANQQQSVGEQMQAVVRYLRHRGVRPGMDILDVYSTINAGAPGLYNRSDAPKGGAPGTVRDKVNNQMAGHRRKALALLGESGD